VANKKIVTISPEVVIQNVDLKFDKNDIINIGIVEYEAKLQEELKSLQEAFPLTAKKLFEAVKQLKLQVVGTEESPGEASLKLAEKTLSKKVQGVVSQMGLKEGQYKVNYYAGLNESWHLRFGRLYVAPPANEEYHGFTIKSRYDCLMSGNYKEPIISYHDSLPDLVATVDKNDTVQMALTFSLEGTAVGLNIAAEQTVFIPASKKANVLYQSVRALYDRLCAIDERAVEVSGTLKNIPKLERQMKAAMAKKIIGSSPIGQELMKVMQEFNKEVQTKALPAGTPKK